jgi:hypothetical protein
MIVHIKSFCKNDSLLRGSPLSSAKGISNYCLQVTHCARDDSGDGGLLCFRDRNETGATGLFVCNPVTQECQQLPDMLIFNAEPSLGYVWIFTQLIVDRATGAYALAVGLYDHRMRAYLEVYSSITNAWTTDSSMPLHSLGVFFNPQNGAVSNNVLYCVVTERVESDGTTPEPLYVRYLVSNDLLGNWIKLSHFKTERRQLHMANVHVVECLGSLYMIVGEWTNYATSELEITIFLLDVISSVAKKLEIDKLSDIRLTEGWQPPYHLRSYTCVGEGDNICLLDLTSFMVLAYNVKQQIWRWLPQCPFVGVKHFHHSSLTNVHRGQGRSKPRGYLFSEVSFQPSNCSPHVLPLR